MSHRERLDKELTQVVFLLRLLSLLVVIWSSVGHGLAPLHAALFILVAVTSIFGLLRTEWLTFLRRHPALALVDVAMCAAMAIIGGLDSPFVLTALTSSVLLGLWVDVLGGAIVTCVVIAMYLGAAAFNPNLRGVGLWLLPFAYISLWLLSWLLNRSLRLERRNLAAVARAQASAASASERATVARELHDGLAKTLQSLALSTAALESLVTKDPEQALDIVRDCRRTSTQAVAELRAMMTELRETTSSQDLGEAATEAVHAWESAHNRSVDTSIDLALSVPEPAQQFELLACLQECLDNVRRHAGPCSVSVSLAENTSGIIELVVADTGRGVDEKALRAARRAGHAGVVGLHERMSRVGGTADFSSEPGQGTTVVLQLPRESLKERQ